MKNLQRVRVLLLAALVFANFALWRSESRAQDARAHRRVVVAPMVDVPAAPVAPAVTAPAVVPVAPLRVRRLVLARDVAAREPVGAASQFSLADARTLHAFVELANDGAPTSVQVRFETVGAGAAHVAGLVDLAVPHASRYRTWGYSQHVASRGRWQARVLDRDGHELAHAEFVVR